jgi:hypothetical protein
VLPHRVELWTSPLPMECSTTELRQHAGRGNQPLEAPQGGRSLPQGHRSRKRGTRHPGSCPELSCQSGAAAACFGGANCGPIRFPISPLSARNALIGLIMTSNSPACRSRQNGASRRGFVAATAPVHICPSSSVLLPGIIRKTRPSIRGSTLRNRSNKARHDRRAHWTPQ